MKVHSFSLIILLAFPTCPAAEAEETENAYLGVALAPLSQELCDEWNAGDLSAIENGVILYVSPGSAAEKAGMETGDILVQLNQAQIFVPLDVVNTVRASEPGVSFSATVLRSGQAVSLSGTFGNMVAPDRRYTPADGMDKEIFAVVSEQSGLVDEYVRNVQSNVVTFPDGCTLANYSYVPGTDEPVGRRQSKYVVVDARCRQTSKTSSWECTVETTLRSTTEPWITVASDCSP